MQHEINVDYGLLKFLVFGLGKSLVLCQDLAEWVLCLSLGYCAGAGLATLTQVSWMWSACKGCDRSHQWKKPMDVKVPCPPKGLVTAQSPPLKKKILNLLGYLLLESVSLPPAPPTLICEGAICVQAARIVERWHLLTCVQMLLQFTVLDHRDLASVLTHPGTAAGNISCAFQLWEQKLEGTAKYSVICS